MLIFADLWNYLITEYLLIIIKIIKDINESKIQFLAKKINADAIVEKEKIKRWWWHTSLVNFETLARRFIIGIEA